eukprot:41981-Prymnesium_polylepis.1
MHIEREVSSLHHTCPAMDAARLPALSALMLVGVPAKMIAPLQIGIRIQLICKRTLAATHSTFTLYSRDTACQGKVIGAPLVRCVGVRARQCLPSTRARRRALVPDNRDEKMAFSCIR